MHELAIAESLLQAAQRHVPAASVLRGVRIRVGPLRNIDPAALELAWRSVAGNDGAPQLDVVELPWRMRCPRCDSQWSTRVLDHHCACGCDVAYPVDGNQLELESVDVEESSATSHSDGAASCEFPWWKTF